MKKLLLVMLAVVFFSGCGEVRNSDVGLTGEKWLETNPTWEQYIHFAWLGYGDNNEAIIALDNLGANVVGVSRDKVSNPIQIDKAGDIQFKFMTLEKDFYYTVVEGSGVATGTLINHLEFTPIEVPGEVSASFLVDLAVVIAEPGNEGLKFGDEFLKIDIYSDPNHKFFIETFYFVL